VVSALRRNAFWLLAGDGLSAFGTWIDFLAILTLAAYQFQVSPYEMAVVSAAGLLPGIVLGPLIGRLCDRKDPKQLLLASIVGRVGATGAILFCHSFAPFVALVALRSVFASVANPAINVMAVRSIEVAARPKFYSFLNVLNNSAKVLAPAIGTVSSSLAGEAVALIMSLAFSSASFIAFAFISLQPRDEQPARAPGAAAAPAPGIAPLIWIAATCAFFIFMVNNLVPLVLQRGGFDKSLLGVLVSCSGAGNILTGLWLANRSASKAMQGRVREMMVPALLQATGFGAMGMVLWRSAADSAWVLAALFFLIGTASARYAIALNVYMSTHYAAAIGSTAGTLQAWQSAMILVAPMAGAAVLDGLGAPALFAFATASAAVSFALFFTLRAAGLPLVPAYSASRSR
jgi:MFS transporter, DHA1 family, staphyloferrin B biosynthesis exporter